MRVHIDYHVEVAGHYYSVPYTLIKQTLDARLTQHTIELFHRGQRGSSHGAKADYHEQHMRRTKGTGWWPQSSSNGPKKSVCNNPSNHHHPGFTSASSARLPRVSGIFMQCISSPERLEAACKLTAGFPCRYKSIESILKNNLDGQPLQQTTAQNLPQDHDNIRGGTTLLGDYQVIVTPPWINLKYSNSVA